MDSTTPRRSECFWNPEPHVLDARSLALLRILLSLYILYDVASRLVPAHPFSISWYISDPPDRAFLHPDDSPHGSPVHKLWFYRGSATFQLFAFGASAVLAALFGLGYKCNGYLRWALWASVVSYGERAVPMHDGSDRFLHHVLLWCALIPVGKVWSFDGYLSRRRESKCKQQREYVGSTNSTAITNVACLGLVLNVFFMYHGTVFTRTVDLFGWSIRDLAKSDWMPPRLMAVHYVLNGSFATRKNALADMIRRTPLLSRSMTASAMLIETLCPMLCMMTRCKGTRSWRHYPAFVLMSLHLGLLLTTNLPNWQLLAMAVNALWIPSCFWDRFAGLSMSGNSSVSKGSNKSVMDGMKKKDDDFKVKGDESKRDKVAATTSQSRFQSKAHTAFSSFLLLYMVYNFFGERGWIAKHDSGDVGEFLRFSQHWVMFGRVGRQATGTILTARLVVPDSTEPKDEFRLDLFRALRTGEWDGGLSILSSDMYNGMRSELVEEMSDRFPSPRWERALDKWGQRGDERRARRLCEALCILGNEKLSILQERNLLGKQEISISHVEMVWQKAVVNPIGSQSRYTYIPEKDKVTEVSCLDR